MIPYETKRLPSGRDAVAPDGSAVRVLLRLGTKGSMAHFELAPGQISTAVTHRTVEEIWLFTTGRGEMWRKQGEREEIAAVDAGVCLTIPLGTHFQFRAQSDHPLVAIGATVPAWSDDDDEAMQVEGIWTPTLL